MIQKELFSYPNTFSNVFFPFISPFFQEAITHKTTDTPTLQSTALSYTGVTYCKKVNKLNIAPWLTQCLVLGKSCVNQKSR